MSPPVETPKAYAASRTHCTIKAHGARGKFRHLLQTRNFPTIISARNHPPPPLYPLHIPLCT